MLKKLLAIATAFSLSSALATVDVNQASEAELDGIKGFGPSTTRLIIAEREKAEFRNWDDFIRRVKGMGQKNVVKYSAQGLTVEGAAYAGAKKKSTGADKAED
jgi:competence protein ComEA